MKKSIPIGFTLSTIVAAVASGQSIYQLTSTTSTLEMPAAAICSSMEGVTGS